MIIITIVNNYISDPCKNYHLIAEDSRLLTTNNGFAKLKCDIISRSIWYRFTNSHGDDMILPTQCIPMLRCQTVSTGWMKGKYPTGIIKFNN